MSTKQVKLKILNQEGLHARPAGVFVKKASEFKSKIEIEFNGQIKNAKSIMNLMSLGLQQNDEFILSAQGEDHEAALAALGQLVENQFCLA